MNGPSYGSTEVTTLQPSLDPQSGLVNGVGASEAFISPAPDATTGLGNTSESRTQRTDMHAQHTENQQPPAQQQRTQAAAAAATGAPFPSVMEQVHQQVTVGEVIYGVSHSRTSATRSSAASFKRNANFYTAKDCA